MPDSPLSKRWNYQAIPQSTRAPRAISMRTLLLATGLILAAQLPRAQELSKDTIFIGLSGPLTGVAAPTNKEGISGAQAYFDHINKRGGIHGRKIEFITIDDKQDAKLAAENTRMLIEEKKVVALFMYRTTPALEAALPLAEKSGTPFVFPQVGSIAAYDPKLSQVFTIRTTFQTEARIAVEQATRLGLTKIAIMLSDDGYGRDTIKGAEAAFEAASMKPVAVEKFDNRTTEVSHVIASFVKAQPQAVLIIGGAKPAAALIKQMRAKGLNPLFISLSNTSTQSYVDELGEAGRGVGIIQVFPSPIRGTALSVEFLKLLQDTPAVKPSYASFQGYVSARVLVEALKRAGKNLSRQQLKSALETVEMDLGGYQVKFSPTNHHGSGFVELSIIGKDGKIML